MEEEPQVSGEDKPVDEVKVEEEPEQAEPVAEKKEEESLEPATSAVDLMIAGQKKKMPAWGILLIIFGVVLAAGGAVMAVTLLPKDKKEPIANVPEEEQNNEKVYASRLCDVWGYCEGDYGEEGGEGPGVEVPKECDDFVIEDYEPNMFPAETITYKGQVLTKSYRRYTDGLPEDYKKCWDWMGESILSVVSSDTVKIEKVAEFTDSGVVNQELYSATLMESDLIKQQLFVLRYGHTLGSTEYWDEYIYNLKSAEIWNNDWTVSADWTVSGAGRVTFRNPVRGCGLTSGGLAILTNSPVESELTKVGVKNGLNIYKTSNEALNRHMYDDYKGARDDGIESYAKFKEALAFILYQDGLEQWNMLQSEVWSSGAECGKPVVYLYPETTTVVDVKVGAKVRVSEPLYDATVGWRGVVAKPSGELTYKGKKYNSLYWDGLGEGVYPDLSGRGVVVRQEEMMKTIIGQLRAQGLTMRETADFVDFWKDHLPKDKWVKLSWLTKAEMDALAPLSVSPKPTTVIRVFLDAEGVSGPMKGLTAQGFRAPERRGFTVVEWGGLLSR